MKNLALLIALVLSGVTCAKSVMFQTKYKNITTNKLAGWAEVFDTESRRIFLMDAHGVKWKTEEKSFAIGQNAKYKGFRSDNSIASVKL